MRIGIVGMPNAGKSTLFNALTAAGAETGDYPFTTVEPNVAVVQVPDERLDRIAETLRSSETLYETIDFHDIAGLVKGASQGEGLGNQFLGSIRETDAICHVIRAHGASSVAHPEGRVDPVADLIETELLAADLESAERRLERVTKLARSGEKEPVAEHAWLERIVEGLSSGRPAREVPVPEAASDALRKLSPLTAKPILYVVNVDEGVTEAPPELISHAEEMRAKVVVISARVEAELRELPPRRRRCAASSASSAPASSA
jgi:GTP-binding protein YchF